MPYRVRAFTLIELLVVVTIVVVLLALLTPALDKAVAAAERARCAGNLHAFGVAIPQYYLDNRSKLLSTMRNSGVSPYPDLARPYIANAPGEWSAEAMMRYTAGVDLPTLTYSGIWYCPSNAAKKDMENQITSSGSGWWCPDYAYFARVDVWNNQDSATRPEDLVERSLAGDKLLMADTLYYWRGGGRDTWWFNHTDTGYSVHDSAWGGQVQARDAILGLQGTNQLFGDSAVVWKDRTRFQPAKMWQPSTEVGYVSHAPSQAPSGDLNFY